MTGARRVAFLCLGTMGYPMAGHLQRAGHAVTVYNRSAARAQAWCAEFGGDRAESPAAAARGAEVVFACTGADDDLRQITLGGAGALSAMGRGTVFVDHTTVSPAVTRELAAQAAERGVAWVDAPVSGGQSGAENGALTVMAGGDAEVFAAVAPLLACYAARARRLGPVGAGQLTKLVNQICIAGVLQGLSEGLDFARRAGLDGRQVVDVISQGAAQSWQMDHRAETMLADRFDFGFAVDWMRKDLAIALAEGRRLGAALPLTALVDGFYAELQAAGGGRLDTSSLIRRLGRDAPAAGSGPATPAAAYHYEGASAWARLSAVDKAKNVVRLCQAVPHVSILDVGAGEGSVLRSLAERGFGERYCAIELSPSALEAIRGSDIAGLEDCRVFDGEHIPYGDGAFDLAVLSHVVEHAEHPRKLLAEAARVARHVFVEVPLELHRRLPYDYEPDDLGHINVYSPASIRRLVQSCGWDVLAQITTHRSRATYTFHGDRLGVAKHALKEWALRAAPSRATRWFTYHGALLCRPPAVPV